MCPERRFVDHVYENLARARIIGHDLPVLAARTVSLVFVSRLGDQRDLFWIDLRSTFGRLDHLRLWRGTRGLAPFRRQ